MTTISRLWLAAALGIAVQTIRTHGDYTFAEIVLATASIHARLDRVDPRPFG